jgi:hypothetical protein
VGERLGTTDRWGRWDRDRERTWGERTAPTARPHRAARERERGSERARVDVDRRGPLSDTKGARARAHAQAGFNGLAWAEMAFSFFLEFLLPFLFIFSRVFNSNSNQVSISNQNKYV